MKIRNLLVLLILISTFLESCCLSKVDCDPLYSNAQKIKVCCTDIKSVLGLKMYLYEKNSDFNTVVDSASFDFDRMSGDSGVWTIAFGVQKAYDVLNYDWLAQLDGKEYKVTNINYAQRQPRCGCTQVELKSFLRNGRKYNQDVVSLHE